MHSLFSMSKLQGSIGKELVLLFWFGFAKRNHFQRRLEVLQVEHSCCLWAGWVWSWANAAPKQWHCCHRCAGWLLCHRSAAFRSLFFVEVLNTVREYSFRKLAAWKSAVIHAAVVLTKSSGAVEVGGGFLRAAGKIFPWRKVETSRKMLKGGGSNLISVGFQCFV